MKKVLALVLAVMMLATVAFAVEIVTPVEIKGGEGTALQLPDAKKDYALLIPDEYFELVVPERFTASEDKAVDAKNFKVEGLNGKFLDGNYVVPVVNKDVALDGVADLKLNGFTVRYIKDGIKECYATYKVADGKLVLDTLKLDGKVIADAKIADPIAAAYDVGQATTTLDSNNIASGWNINNGKKDYTQDAYDNVVTVKVPAKSSAKFEYEALGGAAAAKVGSYDGALTDVVPYIWKISAPGSMTYKIPAENGVNDLLYAVAKDGKVYNTGMKYVIEKDANGEEFAYWTLTTTDYPYAIVRATKPLKNVTATATNANAPAGNNGGTTGNTSNPETGANDIVGVAAALAVVALVSGAAVSLKK